MGRPKPPTTDLSPGSLPDDHRLVQSGPPRGSNNFASTDSTGVERLVELGTKIRKSVLATRGDFAIVRLFPRGPEDKEEKPGALAGEIVFVASTKDVKDWKRAGEWPEGFGEPPAPPRAPEAESSEEDSGVEEGSEDEDEDDLPRNPNH